MKTSNPLSRWPSHPYRTRWSTGPTHPSLQSRPTDDVLRLAHRDYNHPRLARCPRPANSRPPLAASPVPPVTYGPGRGGAQCRRQGPLAVFGRRRLALRARGVDRRMADRRARTLLTPVDRGSVPSPWPGRVEGGTAVLRRVRAPPPRSSSWEATAAEVFGPSTRGNGTSAPRHGTALI